MLGELGRQPLKNKIQISMIKYWLKVVHCHPSRYINSIYKTLYIDDQNGKINWVTHIKKYWLSLGLGDAWYDQSVGNVDLFINILRQRATDIYNQEWHASLSEESRGSLYVTFQNNPSYPLYLEKVKIYKHALALCKFRTFNHKLAIETGRWHKPTPIPLSERTCPHCNVLGDEYHFILECKYLLELRTNYLPKFYYSRPNMLKFIEIMSTNNNKLLNKLAAYIYHAQNLLSDEYAANK